MLSRRRVLLGCAVTAGMAATGVSIARVRSGVAKRVAVIGAGIVGASIAYTLAKRGCEVTVLEQNRAAGQASGNSFAWINASYVKMPFSYHLLSTYSVNQWHRLASEVDLPVRWGGCLEWFDAPERGQGLTDAVQRIQQFGSPTWMVEKAQAAELEPNLAIKGSPAIAYSKQDGAVDGQGATFALLDAAVQHGATVNMPVKVTGLEQHKTGTRVLTSFNTYEVDQVVVAAGVGTTEVAKMAGLTLEQRSTPGFVVTTAPMERLINTVVVAPGVHIHQREDGRVILGEQAGPPKTEAHAEYLLGRPNAYPDGDLAQQHAGRILAIAEQFVPQLADATVERVGIGWRPMPMDGLPIVGQAKAAPNLYFAVMHSGVTLAPIIGHLAGMEILDGVESDLLADFRLERF